jgi:hypothetical protein
LFFPEGKQSDADAPLEKERIDATQEVARSINCFFFFPNFFIRRKRIEGEIKSGKGIVEKRKISFTVC